MGPQHPSTHGVLRIEILSQGEEVIEVAAHIGYLHRCFEKHAEAMTYPQVIPYVDRMDYLSSMNNEHAYVMGVERMLGISEAIPKRVEYIRVLVGELNRMASHFMFLGTYGMDLGMTSAWLWMMRDREHIVRLLEWVSGARLLYNYIWIGGLYYDLPVGFLSRCRSLMDYYEKRLKEFEKSVLRNAIFIARTAKVGILPRSLAVSYGASGPLLRASGLRYDIRRVDAYSVYGALDFSVPIAQKDADVGEVGDCWWRAYIRYMECATSLSLVRQCLDMLEKKYKRTPDFDPQALVPRKIRPKAQSFYVRAENPRGELGFFFLSDGSDKPLRCKARSACFSHLGLLHEICVGAQLADVVAIVGSLDLVLGEVDR